MSLLSSPAGDVTRSAPRGVAVCAMTFCALGIYLGVSALLVYLEVAPFTTGAWLLGGMETMGAVIYVLAGMVALVVGFGLWRLHGWARHLATVIAGVVFVLTIPTISAAVASSQPFVLMREGLKIIACVVLFRYLNTGDAAAAFQAR
jgi:hypothetical protein